MISQPVMLEFLAYYYNIANEWDKEVVATYKDGLNTRCAVLDFERGGARNITPNYWLTDDAISSTSWCYTEGLEYYSKKQILHGFLDRISKNGNLLLNISPKADGSIPQGQKDILLAMGDWLKRYGEGVYDTRAWEIYGEGPAKMGAAHGVFTIPAEGTSKDIRFTRSKDNSILYALLLGWKKDQKEVLINSLSSNRMDIKNLKSVELIDGTPGKYLSLSYTQNEDGLNVVLPEKSRDELAYVMKLTFNGEIPSPDKYAEIDCTPHYYIVPIDNHGIDVLGSDMALTGKRKDHANQWKLESEGKGFYRILNRKNYKKAITCNASGSSGYEVAVNDVYMKDNELWKIEDSYYGYKISNKQYNGYFLAVDNDIRERNKTEPTKSAAGLPFEWSLKEVCELNQKPYKQNSIPGIIEAEDFDTGCMGDAYFELNKSNKGGRYRPDEPVDIDTCIAGGYVVGWTNKGEWMAYTVNVKKTADYKIEFYVAAPTVQSKFHLECDGIDIIGIINAPNTAGYQNWETVIKSVKLDAGKRVLKLVIDNGGLNLDKMVFKEMK